MANDQTVNDLFELKDFGDGRCGFEIPLPDGVDAPALEPIDVEVVKTDGGFSMKLPPEYLELIRQAIADND